MPPVSAEEVRRLVRQLVAETPALGVPSAAPEPESKSGGVAAAPDASIAVGADHGGFRLKTKLIEHLRGKGLAVTDCGTGSEDAVDYPDFAHAVAARVGAGKSAVGIVVDGAGIGSCMVANKVPGVRAALCYDLSTAANAREHNHANVLTLGAGMIGDALAKQIVDRFLETPFGGDRHARRVAKIDAVATRYLANPEAVGAA
jgi:RpiB/LacA/LacB family sugar-phosphate isomerase